MSNHNEETGLKKRIIAAVIMVSGLAWGYSSLRSDVFKTGHPLRAGTGPVELLDADLSTDALPEGWAHRTFFRIKPTDYQMSEQEGRPVLTCTTDNSGSILARETSIPVAQLPILSWNWKITQPINSTVDEASEEGDDHPARLFLRFENESGESKTTEIIWSNQKYLPGDYKIIGNFHHLVANGLDANTGEWHAQTVDLQELYTEIGGTGEPTLSVLGFFCDSDNTGAQSAAQFSDVKLSASAP